MNSAMDRLVAAEYMEQSRLSFACGDPYPPMQETKRSVCLNLCPAPWGDVDKNLAACQAAFDGYQEDLVRSSSAASKPPPRTTSAAAREPKFMHRRFLVGTRVELGGMSAAEALAKMSEFLQEEGPAQIVKDGAQGGRASVHSVVSVPVGGALLRCTVRFKVYRTESQGGGDSCLVLEISRRSGDAVAFGHVSTRARDYPDAYGKPMSEIPAPPPLESLLAKSGGLGPWDGSGLLTLLGEAEAASLAIAAGVLAAPVC
ncbi:unnamed protein product [Prorocentrum cordatum]|uniref:Uncharacterized protein n=1 Tax=Prorocentrum cordatum TaxID=2364126 RepID=A0ABN9UE18_9DINO|nr:unnamed protein product [Polarella glacialis]